MCLPFVYKNLKRATDAYMKDHRLKPTQSICLILLFFAQLRAKKKTKIKQINKYCKGCMIFFFVRFTGRSCDVGHDMLIKYENERKLSIKK